MYDHWRLGSSTTAWLLWLSGATIASGVEVSYTDANGRVWTRDDEDGPATFVIDAGGAIALYNMGLTSESGQCLAVYNYWVALDQHYDFDADQPGEHPVNPTTDEIDFLRSVPINLTPTCEEIQENYCYWGLLLDYDTLDSIQYDFLIETENIGQGNSFEEQGREALVFHNRFDACDGAHHAYEHEGCDRRSVIDDVRDWEELARFLGISHTFESIQHRQTMCETAADFVEHTREMHDKGLYVVAATLSENNGGEIYWHSPYWTLWTRTLEELGMPIVHPPQPNEFDRLIVPIADWNYPVDIWLLRGAVLRFVEDNHDDLTLLFTDPAFVQRHFAQYQHAGRSTYRSIAATLQQIMDDTRDLVRVHEGTLQCVDLDVTDTTNVPSLDTEFACYNRYNFQSLYLECPDPSEIPEPNAGGGVGGGVGGGGGGAVGGGGSPGRINADRYIRMLTENNIF